MTNDHTTRTWKACSLAMALTAALVGVVLSSAADPGVGIAGTAPAGSAGLLDSLGRRVADGVDGVERALGRGMTHLEYACRGRYLPEF